MQKKILSFLLTLAMVVTIMPAITMTAWAEGTRITEITLNYDESCLKPGLTPAEIQDELDISVIGNASLEEFYIENYSNERLSSDAPLVASEQYYLEFILSPNSGYVFDAGNGPDTTVNGQLFVYDQSGVYLQVQDDNLYFYSDYFYPSTDWGKLESACSGDDVATNNTFTVSSSDGVRTIKLLSDVTAVSSDSSIEIPNGKDVVLDLNGHVLNANGKNADHRRVFVVNGKLTIKDSRDTRRNGTGGGKIIKGFESSKGGAININSSGELIVESGAICDCKSADTSMYGSGGGAIHCEGKLTINGGAIHHNMACWGGAIGLNNGTEFFMTGGRIYENESLVMDGAAINMFKNSGNITSTIIGGEIYGNISNRTTNGASNDATVGGVVSAGNAVWVEGTLFLGGNAKIYGNKQGNYVGGSWSNLTNNANLAIVSSADSGKRGTIKVSQSHPLTSGANIWLSQTSEHVRVIPFESGSDLTDYDINTANGFTANNCKYLHIDGLNNTTGYDVCNNEGVFYTKRKLKPTPIWIDPRTPDQKTTELVEESKIIVNKITAYKNGKIKVGFKVLTLSDGTKVTKYQVRRAANKKFTKNLKKYNVSCKSSAKVFSITNARGLKKGTRYYYKVRGKVKLSDGSWVYTKWSNVKSVKCKRTHK